MATTIEVIKHLREETGAGVLDCRKALELAEENFDQALALLLEQAKKDAAKLANHQTSQGRIELYAHGNGRIGVMVEVNTETDFAGRSETVCSLAHELAMQIAAAAPRYVRDEDIPAEVLAEETQKATARAQNECKADRLIPRIVEGYLQKYKDKWVLVRQVYIRDDRMTVAQLLSKAAASVGENIVVRRFVRWELAESETN
jgi:elongation factor Ts